MVALEHSAADCGVEPVGKGHLTLSFAGLKPRLQPLIEWHADLESNTLSLRRLDMQNRFLEVQIIGLLRGADARLSVDNAETIEH